jgi:hypothetical protein
MMLHTKLAGSWATKVSDVVRISTMVIYINCKNYGLTITFNWAINAQSKGNESINPIDAKNRATHDTATNLALDQYIHHDPLCQA